MEGLAGSGDHRWGLEEGARSTQGAVETWWLTGWVGSRCGAGRGCRRGLDKLLVTPPAGRAQGFVFRQLVSGDRAGIRLPPQAGRVSCMLSMWNNGRAILGVWRLTGLMTVERKQEKACGHRWIWCGTGST